MLTGLGDRVCIYTFYQFITMQLTHNRVPITDKTRAFAMAQYQATLTGRFILITFAQPRLVCYLEAWIMAERIMVLHSYTYTRWAISDYLTGILLVEGRSKEEVRRKIVKVEAEITERGMDVYFAGTPELNHGIIQNALVSFELIFAGIPLALRNSLLESMRCYVN